MRVWTTITAACVCVDIAYAYMCVCGSVRMYAETPHLSSSIYIYVLAANTAPAVRIMSVSHCPSCFNAPSTLW